MNIARRASEWYVSRSFTFRLLSAVWMVFILLVLCGVHGSSINAGAKYWKTDRADTTTFLIHWSTP